MEGHSPDNDLIFKSIEIHFKVLVSQILRLCIYVAVQKTPFLVICYGGKMKDLTFSKVYLTFCRKLGILCRADSLFMAEREEQLPLQKEGG